MKIKWWLKKMAVFPKLKILKEVQRKIAAGEKVKIGVFCSGNGDRSPLAHRVLQDTFNKLGYRNVEVFSFGLLVDPQKVGANASSRTTEHAREMGYDLSGHCRRSFPQEDVQEEISAADLLFGISPSHSDMVGEYTADQSPKAHTQVMAKTWTLKGFADKTEWSKGARRLLGGRGTRLALADPYFHPKTAEGEVAFRRDLRAVEMTAKKAVRRLVGMRG